MDSKIRKYPKNKNNLIKKNLFNAAKTEGYETEEKMYLGMLNETSKTLQTRLAIIFNNIKKNDFNYTILTNFEVLKNVLYNNDGQITIPNYGYQLFTKAMPIVQLQLCLDQTYINFNNFNNISSYVSLLLILF